MTGHGYKCGKCGSKALYRDDDRLNEIKYIACLICGNRYPPGAKPIKFEELHGGTLESEYMEITDTNKPLCKECGLKPCISEGHSLCPSCMAKRSNKNRKPPEIDSKGVKKEKAYHSKPEAENPSVARCNKIVVEFKSHISILKEVEKLAEREMRSLDCQILYILKEYMKADRRECSE